MRMRSIFLAVAAGLAAAYNNGSPLGAQPPMGWATWCTDDLCGLLDFCNETEVMSVADALVSTGMKDLGYNLVLLDDCWAATNRTADGNLQPDPTRFPSGIPALAEYVHQRGLYLGLYTCAGPVTCKYNRTGSGGHYAEDAQWFADNNVDYVKMDNCDAPSEPPQQYYGNFSAYLNATGKPIFLSTCNWGEDAPWNWAPSIAQMFRNGPDHLPLWSFNDGIGGQGVLDIINHVATISNASGPWGWSDPDFLETGTGLLSNTESATEFAMWAIMGAPLIVATDVRNMPSWKSQLLLNKDIIAVNQDALRAPGFRLFNTTQQTQAWAKPLAGGDWAVALLNANDVFDVPVTVTWDLLGWPTSANVTVYDLFAHASLGGMTAGYSTSVPPHGTAMVRLTRNS